MFNNNEDVQMNMTADNAERKSGSCKAAGCSTNEVFVRAIDYADAIIADIVKEQKRHSRTIKSANHINRNNYKEAAFLC